MRQHAYLQAVMGMKFCSRLCRMGVHHEPLTRGDTGCSYYPLYPPAPGSLLDTSLADHLQLPLTPDILLLPSDLNPFAKLLSLPKAFPDGANPSMRQPSTTVSEATGQVVCINPGRLAKGAGGGTFATIQIGTSQEGRAAALGQPPATNGKLAHNIHARCRVTVTRV